MTLLYKQEGARTSVSLPCLRRPLPGESIFGEHQVGKPIIVFISSVSSIKSTNSFLSYRFFMIFFSSLLIDFWHQCSNQPNSTNTHDPRHHLIAYKDCQNFDNSWPDNPTWAGGLRRGWNSPPPTLILPHRLYLSQCLPFSLHQHHHPHDDHHHPRDQHHHIINIISTILMIIMTTTSQQRLASSILNPPNLSCISE